SYDSPSPQVRPQQPPPSQQQNTSYTPTCAQAKRSTLHAPRPTLKEVSLAITNEDAAKLSSQVYALVRACPAGRVTTYGAIGKALGHPRGARMIGWIMNETPDRLAVPAQRVISKDGTLTGGWAFGGVEGV